MPSPPVPPQEIALLMQYIAEKAKNVTSPLNVRELSKQIRAETGSVVTLRSLEQRIKRSRLKIHEMNEFEMERKVKMMFALSAPIDAAFLSELKKIADVEVDGQQRIIHYKQNAGKLELKGKHLRHSMNVGEQRDRSIIQFLAEKSKTVNTPMGGRLFSREFKAKSGCSDSIPSLRRRYNRVKNTIFELSGIDKKTKIKMMFLSQAELSDNILEELRQDADVEVDEKGRITKYKSKDGTSELEGRHELSTSMKTFHSGLWQKIFEKVDNSESEEDDNGGSYEKQQIDLIRFLIEKTENATTPLEIKDLSKIFKKEFKVSAPWTRINARIRSIRQRIFKMNQFDMTTKVKMLFALSATIDDDLLKELQKDAIVELDHKQKIAKYEAMEGSLELEREHIQPAKAKATKYNARVVDDSSDSDEDEDEKNARKRGRKSSQTATSSSSVRKSERIKNGMSGGRKRARWVDSSLEKSEDESSEEEEESDNKSMTSEDDAPMDFDTSRVDNGGEDIDYDPPSYHQDNEDGIDYDTPIHNKENLKHALTEPDSEVTSDKKEEAGPSSSVKIETMSLLEFLNHLRAPILQFTPTLAPKIDEKIKKLGEKNTQIPFNLIIESLEMCIQILNTPDEMDSDEATIYLSDFFYRLGMVLLDIPHSSMDEFHVKIRKLATRGDKKVSIEHLRYAMKETLDKITR